MRSLHPLRCRCAEALRPSCHAVIDLAFGFAIAVSTPRALPTPKSLRQSAERTLQRCGRKLIVVTENPVSVLGSQVII